MAESHISHRSRGHRPLQGRPLCGFRVLSAKSPSRASKVSKSHVGGRPSHKATRARPGHPGSLLEMTPGHFYFGLQRLLSPSDGLVVSWSNVPNGFHLVEEEIMSNCQPRTQTQSKIKKKYNSLGAEGSKRNTENKPSVAGWGSVCSPSHALSLLWLIIHFWGSICFINLPFFFF